MAIFGIYTDQVTIISIFVNLAMLIVLYMTGIGSELIKRFRMRFQYHKGGFYSTVMIHKNGTAELLFGKTDDDGSFTHKSSKYAVDRTKTITFMWVPTMLHFEGKSEPADWSDPANAMSTGEIMQIIENNQTNDLVQLIQEYKQYVIIGALIVVAACLAAAFFGWQNYDVLVQGGTGEIIPR